MFAVEEKPTNEVPDKMNPTQVMPIEAAQPNSSPLIRVRASAGLIPWAGPMLLVSARSTLLLAFQSLLALVFLARSRPGAWREAGYYWPVYATLVDIACLAAMRYFTRREKIRLRDLLGPIRLRHGRDIFLGLGYFALIFPLFFLAGTFAQRLLVSPTGENAGALLAHLHPMPLWATIYGLSVWWMIWSPTEEATYQAYALPRLQALTGRTWAAFAVVGFWWAAQHCFLPFVPNLRLIFFRFVAFLPGVLGLMAVYWRTRRLAPLVIAHWPMDIIAAIMTASS